MRLAWPLNVLHLITLGLGWPLMLLMAVAPVLSRPERRRYLYVIAVGLTVLAPLITRAVVGDQVTDPVHYFGLLGGLQAVYLWPGIAGMIWIKRRGCSKRAQYMGGLAAGLMIGTAVVMFTANSPLARVNVVR